MRIKKILCGLLSFCIFTFAPSQFVRGYRLLAAFDIGNAIYKFLVMRNIWGSIENGAHGNLRFMLFYVKWIGNDVTVYKADFFADGEAILRFFADDGTTLIAIPRIAMPHFFADDGTPIVISQKEALLNKYRSIHKQ